MAKKKKNIDDLDMMQNTEETKGSRVVTVLIVIVIVAIWLAIFGVLIKLDIGNFGSQVLRPVLKDVPLINRILPAASDETIATENNYDYKNLSEAIARIKELEKQVDANSNADTTNKNYISQLESEVARLKTFEDNQKTYEQNLADFNKNIVFNDKAPSIDEYKKYYEEINPDNAATIYKQVVEQLQYDQKIKDSATRFAKMEPAKAASTLQVMTGDLDLIAGILDSMPEAKSALILQNMTDEFAAQVTKKMTEVK